MTQQSVEFLWYLIALVSITISEDKHIDQSSHTFSVYIHLFVKRENKHDIWYKGVVWKLMSDTQKFNSAALSLGCEVDRILLVIVWIIFWEKRRRVSLQFVRRRGQNKRMALFPLMLRRIWQIEEHLEVKVIKLIVLALRISNLYLWGPKEASAWWSQLGESRWHTIVQSYGCVAIQWQEYWQLNAQRSMS